MAEHEHLPPLVGLVRRGAVQASFAHPYRLRVPLTRGGTSINASTVASALAATCPPASTVWTHDYQLLVVPARLATLRPDITIALSLHTPFDDPTISQLPVAGELASGLAAADVIGVQTSRDRLAINRFIDSLPGSDIACPHVVVSSVSIDPDALDRLAQQPATTAIVEHHRIALGTRRLILGIDRLDYTPHGAGSDPCDLQGMRFVIWFRAGHLVSCGRRRVGQVIRQRTSSANDGHELVLAPEYDVLAASVEDDGLLDLPLAPAELLVAAACRGRIAYTCWPTRWMRMTATRSMRTKAAVSCSSTVSLDRCLGASNETWVSRCGAIARWGAPPRSLRR